MFPILHNSPFGGSTLITSAPKSDRMTAAPGAATKLAKFTLDHNPDVENSCLLAQVKDNFKQSGSFAELFKAIVTSPAFLTRDL